MSYTMFAPISVAPMIDKTNRHFRWFLRQLTRQTLLYTEMITPSAIIHGDRSKLLDFDARQRPLALQLGGDDPAEMAEAIRIAEDWGYDEYNLNVGCPSDRVQNKNFGACLMSDPDRVSRLLEAMAVAGSKPVTVKHRIGIQSRTRDIDLSAYSDMHAFVTAIADGPASRYTVHARIAILEGLSPKENRSVPPLRYDEVYRLKEDFPQLNIEINGGVKTFDDIDAHLQRVDSVMLGRLSYERPWMFAQMDGRYYADSTWDSRAPQGNDLLCPSRRQILEPYVDYMLRWCNGESGSLNFRSLIWPMLELFAGEPGSRRWKQRLSSPVPAGMNLEAFLFWAMEALSDEQLDLRHQVDHRISELRQPPHVSRAVTSSKLLGQSAGAAS